MAEGVSPWRKPSDVMLIRKKRRSIISHSPRTENAQKHAAASPTTSPAATKAVKRRNPFSCVASKRPALSETFSNTTLDSPLTDNLLFQALHSEEKSKPDEEKVSPETVKFQDRSLDTSLEIQSLPKTASGELLPATSTDDVASEKKERVMQDHCPIDWSLRSKVRFLSERPFSWCCQMSGAQECAATTAFLKGSDSLISQQLVNPQGSFEAKAELGQALCYWIHPNISWLKLFPRITADSKSGKPSGTLQEEKVQASLMADWSESLTSVFQHLRSGYCPYFYLCCHHMTVLFRAAGVAGNLQLHALVTPTSRGFRNALKAEGVEFSMPLNPNFKSTSQDEDPEANEETHESKTESTDNSVEAPSSETAQEAVEADDDEEGDLDDGDDAASSWLHTLGLDAAKFKSLDPKKVKMQREGYKLIDQRPESVLLVEGGEVQGLFNYLLNCSSLVSPTGWQAGIPPTILSPTSFKGAVLKSLQVKSGLVRQGAGEQQAYSLEVSGPILPYCLDSLLQLFSHTQHTYSSTFSVHEPTLPFNAPSSSQDPPEQQVLTNVALPSAHLGNIAKNSILGKCVLREITCESGKYAWIS